MPRFKYFAGDKFGKWTLMSHLGGDNWLARCECGLEKSVLMTHLATGKSKSCRACGGVSRVKHNMTNTKEYATWASMRGRCLNPTNDRYHQYGGRGIKVCDRWNEFANFLEDMGKRPPGTSIDRIDVDGNYEPSNCRWATPKMQMRNRRGNINGKCISETAEDVGLDYGVLQSRLYRGWDYQTAITTPVQDKSRFLGARAKQLGLNPQTVTTRVKRGWSEERALSTPTQIRTRKKAAD